MTIVEQGGGPAPQAAPDLIKETTTQTFVKDVIEESKRQPVLVDFWAEWCGPCRMAASEVKRVAAEMAGKALVLKVDTEKNPQLAQRYGIRSIPNFVVIHQGRTVNQPAGLVDARQMQGWIENALQQPG